MEDTRYFHNIIIMPPRDLIYARLGYRRGKTKVDDRQKEEIERAIEQAQSFMELKGAAKRIRIEKITSSEVVLAQGITFDSRQLSSMLKDSNEALLMAATAGNRIMQAIKIESDSGNLTRAVILDAVASETTDKVLDWISSFYKQELVRQGLNLTSRRYSAGYGDLDLKHQKTIYDTLGLNRLGVKITDSYILIPEKSVTAIAGIRQAA